MPRLCLFPIVVILFCLPGTSAAAAAPSNPGATGPDLPTPQQLLEHNDSGELWPAATGASGFHDLPGAYQAALAVRALRIARGEVEGRIGFAG